MLAPADRRLLLDVLAPPGGYTLDHGVGTTYTLDLLACCAYPSLRRRFRGRGREAVTLTTRSRC
jgi:hypothetical protein